jgi:hypothetical protein
MAGSHGSNINITTATDIIRIIPVVPTTNITTPACCGGLCGTIREFNAAGSGVDGARNREFLVG